MSYQPENIVVIGASHAGVAFADAMRSNGYGGALTMIDAVPGLPVERPPLSKAFLASDAANDAKFLLRKADWYDAQNIQLITGSVVTGVDADAQMISLKDGASLSYDRLVLATGATPRMLPNAVGLDNVFVVRSPDDARALRAALSSAQKAVVIGGGYIGLEAAASLRKGGMDVDVIEAADRLLARVASTDISAFFADLHAANGVRLHIGVGVAEILSAEGAFSGVTMADGTQIEADLLIVGIGVAPDIALAQMAGVECSDAILVDAQMTTSVETIYAIGDGALAADIAPMVAGRPLRVESVHNAQDSAARAAAAINGHAPPAWQAPWFWSEQYDVRLQSAGIVPPAGADTHQVVRPGKREGGLSVWSFAGDQLEAIESVRDPAGYMVGKKCLDMGRHPTPAQVADMDFDLKSFIAGTAK